MEKTFRAHGAESEESSENTETRNTSPCPPRATECSTDKQTMPLSRENGASRMRSTLKRANEPSNTADARRLSSAPFASVCSVQPCELPELAAEAMAAPVLPDSERANVLGNFQQRTTPRFHDVFRLRSRCAQP